MYVWKQLSPSIPHEFAFGLACGMTDTGTVRSSNEDNFLIDTSLGLFAVADGMGGHDSGDIASADALTWLGHYLASKLLAATKISNFRASPFDPARTDPAADWCADKISAMTTLHDALEFTNQRMYQTNLDQRRSNGAGMGTTLTGCWQPYPHGPLLAFHVGDTRLYRFRGGCLTRLTRDHSMYQQALDAGLLHRLPNRNLLLQAVGPASDVQPDFFTAAVEPGDLLLLCSDGLHGCSSDAQIGAMLATTRGRTLHERCARLIEMAKADGSRDNITVLLIQIRNQED